MELLLPKRIHFFEIHDTPYCPELLRNYVTDALAFVWSFSGAYQGALPVINKVLGITGHSTIVDLCSGGGGPVPTLVKSLNRGRKVKVNAVLTDLYPNIPAFIKAKESCPAYINFSASTCSALNVPTHLKGMRTIFLAFHHFSEEQAAEILRNAVQARQPIGVFEICERSFKGLFDTLVFLPLIVILFSPFIKPFSLRRLFLTWVIPLVLLILVFDGVISSLRSYTPLELHSLLRRVRELDKTVDTDSYNWEMKRQNCGLFGLATLNYFVGYPKPHATD